MFQRGDKIKVKRTHANASFHDDVGEVDYYIPFSKYFVRLVKNGHRLIDEQDLEKLVGKAEYSIKGNND